jgi:hypothetical protein
VSKHALAKCDTAASAILRTLDANFTTRQRWERTNRDEWGFAMVATLLVVVILGVLATIVLTLQSPSTTSGTGATTPPGTTSTLPQTVGSGADLAARVACESDYLSITTALSAYRTLNGAWPSPGTSWATSSTRGGPFLQVWPSEQRYFSITWNGNFLSVVPAHGVVSRSNAGTSSPKTGCFAA